MVIGQSFLSLKMGMPSHKLDPFFRIYVSIGQAF